MRHKQFSDSESNQGKLSFKPNQASRPAGVACLVFPQPAAQNSSFQRLISSQAGLNLLFKSLVCEVGAGDPVSRLEAIAELNPGSQP